MQLDELYLIITKKWQKNHAEILHCGYPTYTSNTLKLDYLPLGKPRAAYILTLLVRWCEL
jgi:hypothetical protein